MNKGTFKSEMIKPELGYKVTGTLLDFFDEGKQSSTFYSNLIKLFQATKKDPATKDCIYTFIQTKEEGGNFYIYLQPDAKGCVGKIGNIQNFNTFGFTLFNPPFPANTIDVLPAAPPPPFVPLTLDGGGFTDPL